MAGNLAAPILDRFGGPYSREAFERAQTNDPEFAQAGSAMALSHCLGLIVIGLLSAQKRGEVELLAYRLRTAIRKAITGTVTQEIISSRVGPPRTCSTRLVASPSSNAFLSRKIAA